MKTVRIFISGTVQGVFFRAFVKEQAENLGVYGYVRNLDDGRVEVMAEGYENDVNRLIEACKKGPKQSRITDFETEKMPNQGFTEFKVLRF
jgi:acylphosphatase